MTGLEGIEWILIFPATAIATALWFVLSESE